MQWLLIAVLAAFTARYGGAEVVVTRVIPMENSFYELECPHDGELKYWLLHGKGEAFLPTETYIEEETMTIYRNGSIIFQSLRIEHAGVHLCVKEHQQTVTAHPVPLEVRPLPPKNLWSDVYQRQFITGLVAAMVCFLLFTLSCFVYNNRWGRKEKQSDVSPIIENGYDNPAMVGGEEASSSTRINSEGK